MGMLSRVQNIAPEDAVLIKVLKEQGAIPFIKGNIPQVLMPLTIFIQALFCLDSLNEVWGNARNPIDKERSAGGSTGGDAGMVALNCTPVSIGTDAGGSLRVPAHFCGVKSFKPTFKRVSNIGVCDEGRIICGLEMVAGPVGKTVDDLALTLDALFHPSMGD